MAEDWRQNVVDQLVEIGVGEGILPYDEDKVMDLLKRLAKIDQKKFLSDRVGFYYITSTYSQKGLSGILKRVSLAWPSGPAFKVTEDAPVSIGETQEESISQTRTFQTPAPAFSAHKNECVVSLNLDDSSYDPRALRETLQGYMVDSLEELFSCAVVNVRKVHDNWFDIWIRYSAGLAQIYGLLIAPSWVKDGVTKPVSDFGKRTMATVR